MGKIISHTLLQLYNIRLLFAGYTIVSNQSQIDELSGDVNVIDISSFAEDRKNLKNDGSLVSADYNKSFNEKILQLH